MADKTINRALKRHEIAPPIHIRRLEAALNIKPFVSQVEGILASGARSNSDDDSDAKGTGNEMSKGDRVIHGVVTTKQERQSDRLRLFNFSSVGQEREWLRNILLSSSGSESSSEDETPETKDKHIKAMLKEHALHRKYTTKYYKKASNSRYMYYGAGLLSTIDRYPERRVSRGVQQSSGRGRRGRPVERGLTRGVKSRRGRPRENRGSIQDGQDLPDGIDWEDQLRMMKEETDTDDNKGPDYNSKAAIKARKKAAVAKSPEVLTAKRKRYWQLMAKKELGKVQRARTATHREVALQKKRLATLCCKHWRHMAMQSQKNMKETIWRCKRLSREMQAYWRRYDRAERETRRRMEREAEEQRKMDVELMEAKRQRRKLNFLITQTELYAHFMQRKHGAGTSTDGDGSAEQILRHLDEDRDPRLAAIDSYDSESMKARASRNAREAFRTERARTMQFDAQTGLPEVSNIGQDGDYDQPDIFRGTLKGYQLKGMNWLATLYDQGISGILADEMGLGKTVQCIAFLCHVAERLGVWGPFLVVSPASTLHNWQQEMQRFAPDFNVVPYWGSPSERKILRQFWERKDLHTRSAAFHVVITSYQIVVSDLKYLNRVSWQYMILDEAQAIKSSASMRWKLLLGFSCRNRLLLSGTPIQNSMAELWALLHFIMPTLFDSHDEFNEWFSKDIESHAENKSTIDEKHLSRLHMILKPFMLRRIKKDVENELSDKIEIMVHCPLTIRQKLLYIALRKKIKIEELLHYSVGGDTGHSVDKNFTSNLMNLVMQFRKVCNHPELFERRDVKSPFAMQVDDYHVPKLLAEDAILLRCIPSKRHILYNKFSLFNPLNIIQSERDGGMMGFTRFCDLSPVEVYRVMICGWFEVMIHIEECHQKFEKLRYRQLWWRPWNKSLVKTEDFGPYDVVPKGYYDKVLLKDLLLVCPDGDILQQKREDGLLWEDLLFTNPVWCEASGFFFTFTDHIINYMPETIEHRALRLRHLRGMTIEESMLETEGLLEVKKEEGLNLEEFQHVERDPIIRPDQRTSLPDYIYCVSPKVVCFTRALYATSRSAAHARARHERAENADGKALLAKLLYAARPPTTHHTLQVPDKNQLVSDAGKLTVLDSLLKKLKERGHRVLIYSQMTKMIDLLEEYMWHRKHKYMRLDGSSKISARRDMVADFQARSDIFVFLLSTRAGGLGINLTAADTVIFYDSDWNPTVDQQAMDRAHRLGQTKQVTVYRLICKGTIEERIMQRAREKSEIQRMVISGGNFKPDTLKPKEVVSLLLDDEEIELKYRQKSEEKRQVEERERKRKLGQYSAPPSVSEAKKARESPSEPGSPLVQDDDSTDNLVVADSPPPPTRQQPRPFAHIGSWSGMRRGSTSRGAGRRGRPRGPRGLSRPRPAPAPAPVTAPTSPVNVTDLPDGPSLQSETSLDSTTQHPERARIRRGPGRPRLRTGTSVASRGPPTTRRPRRPIEPLLVPLAATPRPHNQTMP